MSIRTFLKLVEIQTKLASLFPFLIGSLFVMYYYETFNLLNTFIFFSAMLIFDLTTTAINNYMDYTKATNDTYRKETNIIGQKNIPEKLVVKTIFVLLFIASSLGIWLVFKTSLLVLFVGIGCFSVGIFYTFGPIPISRMPLGEIFSGLTMGFGIVFLIVYVNTYDQGIIHVMSQDGFGFQANVTLLLEVALISAPCIFTIAGVMLANNLCDLEEDISNQRYTLPFYLGKRRSINLFNTLYILSFISILVAVYLKLMPMIALLSLVAILPVYHNVRQFNQKQVKTETFVLSIKNLILVNGAIVTMLSISFLL